MRADKIRGNVFVANLPIGLTDEQLAEAFDPYGLVLRAYLARDPATGQTRTYGLVQIAPDRVVETAIAGVSAAGVSGRRVEVRRADPSMSIALPSGRRGPARPQARQVQAGHGIAASSARARADGRFEQVSSRMHGVQTQVGSRPACNSPGRLPSISPWSPAADGPQPRRRARPSPVTGLHLALACPSVAAAGVRGEATGSTGRRAFVAR
ncbi:MAG: hypothetical protein JO157_04680 [Acetobacteraceae bacterium]|nr:hypothetical protein [Acetobacteraceae bacterium]